MSSDRHPHESTLLLTIFLLCGLEFLQSGMITFASGPILGETGGSPEEFTLTTVVYAVFAIGAISMQRWFIERLGWRSFLLATVAVYIAGAALCGSSSSFPQYLAGRAVMGLGGGPFMTLARVMVNLLPANPRRFRGILAFAGALTVGNGVAPWLASLAVSHDHWAGIFVLLAVLSAVAAATGAIALPNDLAPAEKRTHAHPLMTVLMMLGTFLVLYGVLRAPYDYYANYLPLLLSIIVGSAALLYFAWHQHEHAQPLLALKRLMVPRYVAGIATFTLGYMILGANNYMLPQLMQGGLGFAWETIGRIQSAGLIAAVPTFSIMAMIMRRKPAAKKFYVTGFTFLMLSGFLMTRLNTEADLWRNVWPAIAAFGAFITPVMVTTALHSFMDLQGDDVAFSNGQQLKNMLSQFGVSMGVAVSSLGLQWRSGEHLSVLVERFRADDAVFSPLAGQLGAQFSASHGAQAPQVAIAALAQQVSQQAVLLSSLDYFAFLAVVGLLGALVMLAQRILK